MRAALFLRQVERWRSRQLYEMLVLPPTNHWANGGFHCSTRFHFLNQCSSSARLAQNFSGSRTDSRYIRSYWFMLEIWACSLKRLGGLKTRFSRRVDSISAPALVIEDFLHSAPSRATFLPRFRRGSWSFLRSAGPDG